MPKRLLRRSGPGRREEEEGRRTGRSEQGRASSPQPEPGSGARAGPPGERTAPRSEPPARLEVEAWPPGKVPREVWEELSMDLFPFLGRHVVGRLGASDPRTRLDPMETRGALKDAFEALAGDWGCELIFGAFRPEDLPALAAFGMRPYGAESIHSTAGPLMPRVAVPSDLAYYEREGSFLAPLARRIFNNDQRPRLDLTPYRHLLAERQRFAS